ncbi:MAG: hypothetical protein SOZ34_00265 [Clostridia bacterium]|nr:hypothetical protein [Clostridia bacterium]
MQNDFIKRYGGEKNSLRSFISCCGLSVCGRGFEKYGKNIYSCAFFPATYITLKTDDSGKFSIQFADENIQYVCAIEKLSEYDDKTEQGRVFKQINRFKGKVNGAKILFNFDVYEKNFRKCEEAVITAFETMNYGYIREENLFLDLKGGRKEFIGGELFGRKNSLYGINDNNNSEYLPFNISGNRLIIITSEMKNENISEKLYKAYENIKKMYELTGNNGKAEIVKRKSEDKYENYILHEINRTREIINILKSGKIKEIQPFEEEATVELSKLLGKSGEKLLRMYETAKNSGMCELVLPAYEYGGVAAVVKDEWVDNFIERISEEYEKRDGISPSFYICDTASSGIEMLTEN